MARRDVVRVWLRSGLARNARGRPPTAFADRFAGSCCVARRKCHDHCLGPFSTLSGEHTHTHTPDNGSDISSAVIIVPLPARFARANGRSVFTNGFNVLHRGGSKYPVTSYAIKLQKNNFPWNTVNRHTREYTSNFKTNQITALEHSFSVYNFWLLITALC